jgi:hypothetical protein
LGATALPPSVGTERLPAQRASEQSLLLASGLRLDLEVPYDESVLHQDSSLSWWKCHATKNQSLSVDEKDGKILLHCHAGCSFEAVLAAAKIEKRELFQQNGDGPKRAKPKIVKTYDYCNEKGTAQCPRTPFWPVTFPSLLTRF